jgi:nicotinic acid mononucleotide adenylyltransferase
MERNEIEKNKEITMFHEKDMIKNLKKYYNIDDHCDLLKYIKKNVTNTNL